MAKNEQHRNWTQTLAGEIAEVRKRRRDDAAVEQTLVGLAFSGGGIRSATFGLGVLETLRRLGWLKKVDYLSTVSGGGYIGAWLSAGCKRHAGWLEPDADWNESIGHLRRYSNYLSPKVGFFSADTWSMATIWLRNTLLVQATVVLAIAGALMLPRPLFEVFQHWPAMGNLRWLTIILFVGGAVGIAGNQVRVTGHEGVPLLKAKSWLLGAVAGSVCLLGAWLYGSVVAFDPFGGGAISYTAAAPIALALVAGGFALQPVAVRLVAVLHEWWGLEPPQQVNYTQAWVQGAVVAPLMVAAFLVTAILWAESLGTAAAGPTTPDQAALSGLSTYGAFLTQAWRYWPFPLSVVFASLWLLSLCSVSWRDWKSPLAAIFAAAVGVAVLHALLSGVMLLLHGWVLDAGAWKAFVWGPPLVSGAFVLTIVAVIGMLGRQSTDGVREWWSRLGAWLGIYATAWMVISVAAVYGPYWVTLAATLHPLAAVTAGGGWVGTVIAGLLAGGSNATSGTATKKSPLASAKEAVAVVVPFVFIAGLLIAVAYVLDTVVRINSGHDWMSVALASAHGSHGSFLRVSMAVWGGCIAALVVVAARVDVNEFSLNAFYRHRLVRCYLGATRLAPGERQPQNFTGFDDGDDIPLADLVDAAGPAPGPLHIVNCALNLGGSSDLALHTRHSAAFTLTPLTCGSGYISRTQAGATDELGYVPTREYGGRLGAPTLGQAISVSGAAASPNMGYHTSPVVAFLLTVFNVRLGWWFPNPGGGDVDLPSPHFNLPYLFAELFGGATDKSKFVMISDGGHFENLAAYELVRRRCRTIIICDGECDPTLAFEGLGTLMRMCEVDFGATITIDVSAIRAGTAAAWSTKRFAVGTISYADGSPDGTLIYLKASMNGREDTSILQYKASHPTFPHEATGDQFYREDQFESYRRLGREVAREAVGPANG